jgi:hypothetical protein
LGVVLSKYFLFAAPTSRQHRKVQIVEDFQEKYLMAEMRQLGQSDFAKDIKAIPGWLDTVVVRSHHIILNVSRASVTIF